MTRRTGQIISKGNGKYKVMIFLGRDAAGKKQYFIKTITGTKKDADKYLTKKLNEKNLGEFLEPAEIPLDHLLDEWFEITKNRISQKTFEGYERMANYHLRSYIGKKRICDLDTHTIQKRYNEIKEKGLSSHTVRQVHKVINQALSYAVRTRRLKSNPCQFVNLPKVEHKEMKYFTESELSVFLEFAKDDRYYAAFVIAAETGMRIEEYLGLQWKDVDFEAQTVSIQRALITNLNGGGYLFEQTKNGSSRRNLDLSNFAIQVLKAHRRIQLEQKLAILDVYEDLDLIFPTQIGTPTLYGNLDQRHFKKIIKKANDAIAKANIEYGLNEALIPVIRLYDLRHTCATLLLKALVPVKVVSERLGHRDPAMTLRVYQHVIPAQQKEATGIMERLMLGHGKLSA